MRTERQFMIDYLKNIMEETDYKRVIQSASNLGNNPTRAQIEALLQEDGGELPTFDVTFFLIDPDDHNMQVMYIKELDEYFYTSMSMAKNNLQTSLINLFNGNLGQKPTIAELNIALPDPKIGANLVEDTSGHKFLVLWDGTDFLYEKLSVAAP
jgi:hypothetical protein